MPLTRLDRLLKRTLPMGRIEPCVLPSCPEITLGLISADFPLGPLPPDVVRQVINEPAYWALCWGSGLALARWLLDRPERVRDRQVLDLGSGSGVVAVAAALAGARRVIACDTDPAARQATRTNAALNGVAIEVVASLDEAPRDNDLLLMADVLYDRSNLPLLEQAARYAREVLVADSRIAQLPDPAYRPIGEIDASTYPNLGEFDEFRTVRLFHRGAACDG
ncbi:MAG TPA: 50S ribosomal protein L11 methyltransferase [Pseudomonadales bacterium]